MRPKGSLLQNDEDEEVLPLLPLGWPEKDAPYSLSNAPPQIVIKERSEILFLGGKCGYIPK